MQTNKMKKYYVTVNGKIIDEVFYTADCSVEYVRDSLINEYNHLPDIVICVDKNDK